MIVGTSGSGLAGAAVLGACAIVGGLRHQRDRALRSACVAEGAAIEAEWGSRARDGFLAAFAGEPSAGDVVRARAHLERSAAQRKRRRPAELALAEQVLARAQDPSARPLAPSAATP